MPQHATIVRPSGQIEQPNRRRRRILAGLVVLAAVPAIGWTLAASISINSGNGIEFGQGATAASACDAVINITPGTSWNNTSGIFEVTSITLSDVDLVAGGEDCQGKTFLVTMLDSGGTDIGNLKFAIDSSDDTSGTPDDFTEDAASTQDHTIANITFAAASDLVATITEATKVDASLVARITLQTS